MPYLGADKSEMPGAGQPKFGSKEYRTATGTSEDRGSEATSAGAGASSSDYSSSVTFGGARPKTTKKQSQQSLSQTKTQLDLSGNQGVPTDFDQKEWDEIYAPMIKLQESEYNPATHPPELEPVAHQTTPDDDLFSQFVFGPDEVNLSIEEKKLFIRTQRIEQRKKDKLLPAPTGSSYTKLKMGPNINRMMENVCFKCGEKGPHIAANKFRCTKDPDYPYKCEWPR